MLIRSFTCTDCVLICCFGGITSCFSLQYFSSINHCICNSSKCTKLQMLAKAKLTDFGLKCCKVSVLGFHRAIGPGYQSFSKIVQYFGPQISGIASLHENTSAVKLKNFSPLKMGHSNSGPPIFRGLSSAVIIARGFLRQCHGYTKFFKDLC